VKKKNEKGVETSLEETFVATGKRGSREKSKHFDSSWRQQQNCTFAQLCCARSCICGALLVKSHPGFLP
jgi:hypothetical protein